MKEKIITILLFLLLIPKVYSQVIDFDYDKCFNITYVCVDYNQNEELDEGEFYQVDVNSRCLFYIEYRDFSSAGNSTALTLKIINGDNIKILRGNLEDIYLYKDGNTYLAINKFKEKLFSLFKDEDLGYFIVIFNEAILK